MDTAHLVDQTIKQFQPVFTDVLTQRAVRRYGGGAMAVGGKAGTGKSL